jgi:hypothetical protein
MSKHPKFLQEYESMAKQPTRAVTAPERLAERIAEAQRMFWVEHGSAFSAAVRPLGEALRDRAALESGPGYVVLSAPDRGR